MQSKDIFHFRITLIQEIMSFMFILLYRILSLYIVIRIDSNNILQNLVFYQELPKVIQDTSLIKLWYAPTIRKSNIIRRQSKMFFYFIRYVQQT